jgi:hypothetical protein
VGGKPLHINGGYAKGACEGLDCRGRLKQRWLVDRRGPRRVDRSAIKVSDARGVFSRGDAPSVHGLGEFWSHGAGSCTTVGIKHGTFVELRE